MDTGIGTLTAQSCDTDERRAVREFHAGVSQPRMALVIFFCSSEYDLDLLADEMRTLFAGVQVVGCTTAGELGPGGCRDHSLTGVSFSAETFAASTGLIERLQGFESAQSEPFVQDLLGQLEAARPQATASDTFAFLLIDGMSVREEQVASALQHALGEIPLVGGSAGDGLEFGPTYVYSDGRFHADSAVVFLVSTPLPFLVFKTQHFVPTSRRVVVTSADAEHRIVHEIDGWSAADAYARLADAKPNDLDSLRFAASPVVVLIDGTNYVRSIQKANPDGSLTFFCAIEEGVVLRVGHGIDLEANLRDVFAEVAEAIGPPQLVLGCDCILRKIEIVQSGIVDHVEQVFIENNVVGLNTYGEQYHGVHVNQTFTGIAFGRPVPGTRDD